MPKWIPDAVAVHGTAVGTRDCVCPGVSEKYLTCFSFSTVLALIKYSVSYSIPQKHMEEVSSAGDSEVMGTLTEVGSV